MKIPQDQWQWFGNAGHLIVGQWCRFHLTTKVGNWLVSTVGEYVHPMHGMGSEQKEADWLKKNPLGQDIGCGRKFETMVFAAGELCDCGCGLPSISGSEVDSGCYNDRKSATEGHMALCLKFANHTADSETCQRCRKEPATEPHTCPFAEDIHDDSETLCNCCDDCAHECAMDI